MRVTPCVSTNYAGGGRTHPLARATSQGICVCARRATAHGAPSIRLSIRPPIVHPSSPFARRGKAAHCGVGVAHASTAVQPRTVRTRVRMAFERRPDAKSETHVPVRPGPARPATRVLVPCVPSSNFQTRGHRRACRKGAATSTRQSL